MADSGDCCCGRGGSGKRDAPASGTSLYRPKFAEFAVQPHAATCRGKPAAGVRRTPAGDHEWFNGKSEFPMHLPVSAAVPGEERALPVGRGAFSEGSRQDSGFRGLRCKGRRCRQGGKLMVTRDRLPSLGVESS